MFDSSQLLGYLAIVVALVLIPGPNTLLILGHSIAGGRAAGLAAVAGIEAGTLAHTVAAALGLSAVLATSTVAFELVKAVGSAYLMVLGVRALLRSGRGAPAEHVRRGDLPRVFRHALLANLVNPKVALFFLALLPQFVRPERGPVLVQFVVLGLILSVVGLSFGSLLAVAAGRVGGWLRNEIFARWEARLTGSVFLVLGVRIALAERQ